jgi:hypothetical protein
MALDFRTFLKCSPGKGETHLRLQLYFPPRAFCDRVHRQRAAMGERWAQWIDGQGDNQKMNTKQQFATGFIAMVIIASIAFMPVNAEVKENVPKPRPSGTVVTPLNTAELPHEQVRDQTYN